MTDKKELKESLKKYKFEESTVTVNTLDDAVEALSFCVKVIMIKKGANPATAASIISDGIISGLDGFSSESSIPQEVADKRALYVGKLLLRQINSYLKTK